VKITEQNCGVCGVCHRCHIPESHFFYVAAFVDTCTHTLGMFIYACISTYVLYDMYIYMYKYICTKYSGRVVHVHVYMYVHVCVCIHIRVYICMKYMVRTG
jgi:hypothetical protein